MSSGRPSIARPGSEVVGFVLAGGKSSRMGQDKALLSLAGQTLAGRALSILTAAGLPASLAGASPTLATLAPVIQDNQLSQGPLAGICAALESTQARWAVFLSVDLPFLLPSLINYFVRHAQLSGSLVTLPAINGFPQTFPVVLAREALPSLAADLAVGRRGCYSAFRSAASAAGQPVTVLPVEMLVQAGQLNHPEETPAYRWFLNLNTPADFDRAQDFAANSRIA